MGLLRRAVPYAFPFSRVGAALWAWRHRGEIAGWAGYAARAVPRLTAGETSDVVAEGRLRARLTADGRTRDVDSLHVDVHDGVATLSGTVDPEVHRAAVTIAEGTTGIKKVRDELRNPGRRGVLRRS